MAEIFKTADGVSAADLKPGKFLYYVHPINLEGHGGDIEKVRIKSVDEHAIYLYNINYPNAHSYLSVLNLSTRFARKINAIKYKRKLIDDAIHRLDQKLMSLKLKIADTRIIYR